MRETAIRSLFAFALGLVAAAEATEACSCVGPIATCRALASATAVLEATVESIAPGEPEVDPTLPATFSVGMNKVTLRDLRSWRGVSADTIFTPSYSASCGYEFQRGARYLVVAHRLADGRLGVTRCGLTRPIDAARGIIDYLRAAGTSTPPPIRVWGSVERAARWIDFAREFTGVPGARVTFEGVTRLTVETAADGRYVADGLPPGRYTVSVAIPADMKELGRVVPASIELGSAPGAACLEVGFLAPIQSSISGVVVDERGQPVANAFVTLRFPDQPDYSRGAAGAGFTTGDDGRFEFKDLPPGRYVVGISSRATGAQPAPGETLVELRLGERISLNPLVVRLPILTAGQRSIASK